MDLELKTKEWAAKLNQFNLLAEEINRELKEEGPELIQQAKKTDKAKDLLKILQTVPLSGMGECDFRLTQLRLELGHRVYPV